MFFLSFTSHKHCVAINRILWEFRVKQNGLFLFTTGDLLFIGNHPRDTRSDRNKSARTRERPILAISKNSADTTETRTIISWGVVPYPLAITHLSVSERGGTPHPHTTNHRGRAIDALCIFITYEFTVRCFSFARRIYLVGPRYERLNVWLA